MALTRDAGAVAARIADGDGAVVMQRGEEHVGQLVLVARVEVDHVRNAAQVADVEEAVVGRAVVAGEAAAVHAEHDVEILQADVVDDLVERALQEGGVDRAERLVALGRHAGGEEDGVLLGDADVEIFVRDASAGRDRARCRWAWRR